MSALEDKINARVVLMRDLSYSQDKSIQANLRKQLRMNRTEVDRLITEEYGNTDQSRYFRENLDIMCVTKLANGDYDA